MSDTVNVGILQEVGARVARQRLNKNLTQAELADRSGISLATLKRIEHGSHATLFVNMLNVLHALGVEQNLDQIIPEIPLSPVQLAKLQGSVRKRAGRKRTISPSLGTTNWTWRDDKRS